MAGRAEQGKRARAGRGGLITPVLLLGALLTACDPGGQAPKEQGQAVSAQALAQLRPQDDRLADLYEVSCKACHANPDSGAPPVRVATAWAPRWDKGPDTLLRHTLEGFNGMPAGGQCFSCTQADYQALIRFLAGHDPAAPQTAR